MSGKTKFILVFSRMQPNFTARSDVKVQKKVKSEEFFNMRVKKQK